MLSQRRCFVILYIQNAKRVGCIACICGMMVRCKAGDVRRTLRGTKSVSSYVNISGSVTTDVLILVRPKWFPKIGCHPRTNELQSIAHDALLVTTSKNESESKSR